MKKTLLSICALALSLTASAQILETPKGKLIDNMYRSSDSWVKKGWTGTDLGRYEGLVSKIVEGEDGCLYVYNPLSGLNSKSWLKLDKVSNGKYKASLPQVIYKEENGQKLEPMENLVVSVEDGLSGTVIDMLAPRKGLMQNMSSENGLTTMEFIIPTRGLLGFRGEFILATKGE